MTTSQPSSQTPQTTASSKATGHATSIQALVASSAFQSAKRDLIQAIMQASAGLREIKPTPSSEEVRSAYQRTIQEFVKDRGRDLYFPFVSSGIGSGPYVELMDGSVKLDMISGIGINFFGHTHPELIGEMVNALSSDVMQGNLEPGIEARELLKALLSRVGAKSRLTHGWLMCSGTMSNEVALKIIRQKKFPATKVIAFKDCFAGRSTAMQEITDNPGYRQGQPVYGEVEYLPFYDPALGLEKSIQATLGVFKEHIARYPGKFAALMLEIVQGEGGFNSAPREFYVKLFEAAHAAGLAIWADEIQTFGRTGELFAYQKFGLNEYVDVVTVGKMLQACGVLFTDEYNPKPGLVAGTFSGSAVALRTGRRVLELLDEGKYFGPEGRTEKLSAHFTRRLRELSEGSCKGKLGEIRALGGMIAFAPFSGTMDEVKTTLFKLFDMGVIAFYCGHGPYLIRMLPPFGAMDEKDIDRVCSILEKAILEIASQPAQGKA